MAGASSMSSSSSKTCQECGLDVREDERFCHGCGLRLDDTPDEESKVLDEHTETVASTSDRLLATGLSEEDIPLNTELVIPYDKSEVRTPDGETVLDLRFWSEEKFEMDDVPMYTISGPDGDAVFAVDNDGFLGDSYTLYDVATDQPLAAFDRKRVAVSNRAWQVKDPHTEEVTHKLNTDSRLRERFWIGLKKTPSLFSLLYEPSLSFSVKTIEGELVCRERVGRQLLVFFGELNRTVTVEPDQKAIDVSLSLLLLSQVRDRQSGPV